MQFLPKHWLRKWQWVFVLIYVWTLYLHKLFSYSYSHEGLERPRQHFGEASPSPFGDATGHNSLLPATKSHYMFVPLYIRFSRLFCRGRLLLSDGDHCDILRSTVCHYITGSSKAFPVTGRNHPSFIPWCARVLFTGVLTLVEQGVCNWHGEVMQEKKKQVPF